MRVNQKFLHSGGASRASIRFGDMGHVPTNQEETERIPPPDGMETDGRGSIPA